MQGAWCMVQGNTTSYVKPAHRIQHPVPSTGRFLNLFTYISFLFIFLHPLSFPAQMAKLVDALVSGTSVSNDVQVRVLFWAQIHLRPDGEIGRHASLRGWCSQGCASSSLVLGTINQIVFTVWFLLLNHKSSEVFQTLYSYQSKDCYFLSGKPCCIERQM